MPLHFTIDHTDRFVLVRAEGVVVLADVEAYCDTLVVQGAMPYPKLFDATTAEFAVSDADMMALGARVAAYAAYDPRGPIGFVAVAPAAIDALRRVINLGGARRPARIFPTIDQAREWLLAQGAPLS